MVASANSMEVGVLAMAQDQVTWQQWTQEDAARAELPLTPTKQETYPIGLALDTSSTRQLPWGTYYLICHLSFFVQIRSQDMTNIHFSILPNR